MNLEIELQKNEFWQPKQKRTLVGKFHEVLEQYHCKEWEVPLQSKTNAGEFKLRTDFTKFILESSGVKEKTDGVLNIAYSGTVLAEENSSEYPRFECGAEFFDFNTSKKELNRSFLLQNSVQAAVESLQLFAEECFKPNNGENRVHQQWQILVVFSNPQKLSEVGNKSPLSGWKSKVNLLELKNNVSAQFNAEFRNLFLVNSHWENNQKFTIDFKMLYSPRSNRSVEFYDGDCFELYLKKQNQTIWCGGGGVFGKPNSNFCAAGFKVLPPWEWNVSGTPESKLRVAVPKGRLLTKVLELFSLAGVEPELDLNSTRSLVVNSKCGSVVFYLVKNSDAPMFVEHNLADVCFSGTDVLEERVSSLKNCFSLADFSFGKTRICVAGKPFFKNKFLTSERLKIATKYPILAARHFNKIHSFKHIEYVPLQGSVELAAAAGFADAIFDLVETGHTLKENGLEIYEEATTTTVNFCASASASITMKQKLLHLVECWQQNGTLSGSGQSEYVRCFLPCEF